jgi:hypothetical protein
MKVQNLIRFSATFYAFNDSMEMIKHNFSGVMKMKFKTVYNIMSWLLNEVQKKMNNEDKEMFERGSELSHEALTQLFKCEHPELMIELMKEMNRGNVKIEKENE